MTTYLVSDYYSMLLGIGTSDGGGFGIQISNSTREAFSMSIIAIKKPAEIPEPATLAVVGLGLTGLGLARRRK